VSGKPAIELHSVGRDFGEGATAVTAVCDVTLKVDTSEVVAIMGPSGSGKSTLLSIIGGLLDPTRGKVFLSGRPLAEMTEAARARQRRRGIGFVFQNFNLLTALTAVENVEVSLALAGYQPLEARRLARSALAAVGLAGRERFLPRQLSGGQQQRVALARALAPCPSLILADEPTGNLDSATGRAVLDIISRHAHQQKAAAVIVSHDLRVRGLVDRCFWMEDGMLQEERTGLLNRRRRPANDQQLVEVPRC